MKSGILYKDMMKSERDTVPASGWNRDYVTYFHEKSKALRMCGQAFPHPEEWLGEWKGRFRVAISGGFL